MSQQGKSISPCGRSHRPNYYGAMNAEAPSPDLPVPSIRSPLLSRPGAVEAGWPDEGVAAHYGDPMREQRALDASAGFVDRSNRGVLTITGPDRLSWLHSLTTQHLEQLAAGQGAQALILS